MTEVAHRRHVVAHEQYRPSLPGDRSHLVQALLLKLGVPDGQYLVHDQDLGLKVGCDGESQSHVHAARIELDRCIQELLDLGEADDLVELSVDLTSLHAQQGAVQVDVLSTAQLRMKASADF